MLIADLGQHDIILGKAMDEQEWTHSEHEE